ncbi:MAG: hypothetical protein M3151_07750 [Actinomycetota bacterium]|nr:hypothetical protein [Actinomycetota bacterium]
MATESRYIEDTVRGIRESTYEIQTESRLAYSGLKREQDIASVLERFAWLYNAETVRRAEEAYRAEGDPKNKERLRRVYHYLLDGCVDRRTAPIEDDLATFEAGATVEIDGETIPYHNVPIVIAGEHDFEKRERLREAALSVVVEGNARRLEILRARLVALGDEFGYHSYTTYNAERKRVDYDLLRSRMDGFLVETEEDYEALMGRWVKETTGRDLGEIGSHHFTYVGRLPQYDEYFRKDKLVEAYERTLLGLGLDPASQKNIHIDAEERPTKNSRARCYAPDPPGEVHLLIKPVGGLEDYMAFFHEAGHAQHFGNEDPALDYVERAVSTSYSLTEIYSFLLEHLTQSRTWLTGVVGLPEKTATEVAYYARLAELFLVRRYAAKLGYELDFFEDPLEEGRNRGLYAATLSRTTRFLYDPQNYLNDMDPGYYSADYLRAWITESMLRHHLEHAYGEGWFTHPEAGEFLRGLWATGERDENEDVARMIGCEPFDTTYLVGHLLNLG